MKYKFYIISRIYTPLYNAFKSSVWQHSGSPAYYNFIKTIDSMDSIDLKILFLLDEDSVDLFKSGNMKFNNLNSNVEIIPYIKFKKNRSKVFRKFEFIFNLLYQYLYIFFKVKRNAIYYIDRKNIILGNLLSLKNGFIVYRVLGITSEIYNILFKEKGLKNKLFYNALTLSNSMTISSNDGSWAELTQKLLKNDFHLMFNGCDIKPRLQNKKMQYNKNIIISYISRLEEGKGHRNFFNIIKQLKEKNINNFRVNVIGGGSLEDELKKYVGQLKLLDYINFTGSIGHSEVSTFLDKTDIFISLNYYGIFGNNVIEACSKGIPIIALDNKNVSFLYKKYFYTVDKIELDKISDFIYVLMTEKDIYEKYSLLSKEFFEDNITSWSHRIENEISMIITKYIERKD